MNTRFREDIKSYIMSCNTVEELLAMIKEKKFEVNGIKMSTSISYLNALIINSLPDEFSEQEQYSLLYTSDTVDGANMDKYMYDITLVLNKLLMMHDVNLVKYMIKLKKVDDFLSDNSTGVNRDYGEEYRGIWELMPTDNRKHMLNICKAEILTRINSIFYYFTDVIDGVVMHMINGEDQLRLVNYNDELIDLCKNKSWIDENASAMDIVASKNKAGERLYEIIAEEKIEPFYTILKAGGGWRKDQFLDTVLGLGVKPMYNSYSVSMSEVPIKNKTGKITQVRTRRTGSFIFPYVIKQGWLEGVTDKISMYVDRATGRASQAILKLKTQDAGKKVKEIYMLSQAINFASEENYTCDSVLTNPFELKEGKNFKRRVRRLLGVTMVIKGKDIKIPDTYDVALKELSYLEGQTIQIYTPLTCNGITRSKGICRRCAGSVVYDNNTRTHLGRHDHAGATFGRQLGQPVQQVIISVKHMTVGNPVAPTFRLIKKDGKVMNKLWDIKIGKVSQIVDFNVDGEILSVRFDSGERFGERIDGDYIKSGGKGGCIQYLPWSDTPYAHTQTFTVTTDTGVYTFQSDIQLYTALTNVKDVDGNEPTGIHWGTKDYILNSSDVKIFTLIENMGVTQLFDNVNLIDKDTDKPNTPSYDETVDRIINLKEDYHVSIIALIFKALLRDKNNKIADMSDPNVVLKFVSSATANQTSGRFTGILPGGFFKAILNNEDLYDIQYMYADNMDKLLNY